MNKKTLLIAVLGIAGSVTWAPQILGRFSDEPNPVDQYPDPTMEGDSLEVTSPENAGIQAQPIAQRALPTPEVDPVADLVGSSSEELLRALEVFRGPAARVEFDALAAQAPAWSKAELAPLASAPEPQAQSAPAPAMTANEVDSFLSARNLTAIVRGENGQWALLDGQIVRPGAELMPGLIAVESVRARSLELSTPAGPRRLTLPGLAIRQPAVVSGGDLPQEEAVEEAAAPAPEAAPAPALPDMDALLEQLETALDTEAPSEAL